jgi:hypothetical protein
MINIRFRSTRQTISSWDLPEFARGAINHARLFDR